MSGGLVCRGDIPRGFFENFVLIPIDQIDRDVFRGRISLRFVVNIAHGDASLRQGVERAEIGRS
jgi:hypothetical protein